MVTHRFVPANREHCSWARWLAAIEFNDVGMWRYSAFPDAVGHVKRQDELQWQPSSASGISLQGALGYVAQGEWVLELVGPLIEWDGEQVFARTAGVAGNHTGK